MSSLLVGVFGGVLFGAIAVLSMLPLSFPDKRGSPHCGLLKPVRHRLRGWRGPPSVAGMGCGAHLRPALECAGCDHYKGVGADRGHGAVGGTLIGLAVRHWGSVTAAA